MSTIKISVKVTGVVELELTDIGDIWPSGYDDLIEAVKEEVRENGLSYIGEVGTVEVEDPEEALNRETLELRWEENK